MTVTNDTQTPAAPSPASVSRRWMLGRAVGVAAGAVGASMLTAATVAADSGDPVVAGQQNFAAATTEVKYNGASPFDGIVLFGNDSNWAAESSVYPAACGGWAGGGLQGGRSSVTTGVYGYSEAAVGNGVVGRNGAAGPGSGGAGVLGISEATATIGVRAVATAGTALKVEGPAAFSRSGRVNVLKGKAYVDVTVTGGLGSSAGVLATIQTYRSGVYVAGCRKNYPTAGKVRIYLNKVASTTSSTPVSWFVVN